MASCIPAALGLRDCLAAWITAQTLIASRARETPHGLYRYDGRLVTLAYTKRFL